MDLILFSRLVLKIISPTRAGARNTHFDESSQIVLIMITQCTKLDILIPLASIHQSLVTWFHGTPRKKAYKGNDLDLRGSCFEIHWILKKEVPRADDEL